MKNFGDNLPYIRYGNDIRLEYREDFHQSTIADLASTPPLLEFEPDFQRLEGPVETYKGVKCKFPPPGSAVVVGRGPSLFEHKHCEMLHEHKYQGLVVASDGGLLPLLEAGVIPDVVVTVDGSPIIKKFFDHPLVRQYGGQMKWVTTVTVDHGVFLMALQSGMKIYWFNPQFDDYRNIESWTLLQRLISRTDKFPLGVPHAMSGGNSGAFAWIMAMSIFNRSPIALIGIDFGYPEGTNLEDTHYFSNVLKIAEGDRAQIKDAYKKFYHPTFKTKAYVDFVFYHYRQAFLEMQKGTAAWYQHYGGTINCTEGGTLFGLGITCLKFKKFLEKYPK